ncbi:hypothetical protein F5878DRAFT_645100 [Lentinula raphanica]|uniref:Uncharacterized protein n=1 Tax=Lentinula raphanica TaxID=153919 RepID=A0AA38U9W9_9AGAR|nr:hypothetical protein C8R42DRAFT_638744 [Lentinula raphanica]KAJ3756693.1 hypothetical protein EV360DRAFT_84719 [Lentinula raphanica]KAJ3834480.1 hypothetical protein F5878DRAFT_645100 [Lentinula raphanica]
MSVDDVDGFSSPYRPSASDAGTSPYKSTRRVRRSTNPSIPIKRAKIDGSEAVENQAEDVLMLQSSSQTGSKKLHRFYDLGLDDSQLESYPYYQNLKACNDLSNDDSDFEVVESQRGRNGYGYDLKSNLDSDPDLRDDSDYRQSTQYAQIKSEPEEIDNNIQVALDRVLAENRMLSAQNTELRAQNRILLDILQRTGDIFSDITHTSKRLDAPAKFRDTLNAYFLENGVEESQAN